MQEAVDGDGTAGRQGNLGGGHRAERRIVHFGFPEENIGTVAPQYLVYPVGMGAEPGADRLHRHLLKRDFSEIGENAARPGETLAGFRRIGDAHQPPVAHMQACRTLDVDKEGVHLVGQPGDLQIPAGKRTALDLASVEIFDGAVRRGASEGEIGIHSDRAVGIVDIGKVVRARQERNGKVRSSNKRGRDLRLVEAGDEAGRAVRIAHMHGNEKAFEESASIGTIRLRNGPCRLIGIRESHAVNAKRAGTVGFFRKPESRTPESRESLAVVVPDPTGQSGEGNGAEQRRERHGGVHPARWLAWS